MNTSKLAGIVLAIIATVALVLLIFDTTVWRLISYLGGFLLVGLGLHGVGRRLMRFAYEKFPFFAHRYRAFSEYAGEYALTVDDVRSQFKSTKKRIEFVFYFDGPARSEHHVLMWISHLEKLQREYIILSRKRGPAATFHALGLPVVFAPKLRHLSIGGELGAKVVFYANNGTLNTHMLRYNELTHVQLLHGESDKASSFNPLSGAYDIVAVAGPAGQERYAANDVFIPRRKFRIVSRPQVSVLDVVTSPNKKTSVSVLYATTWSGFHDENDHSSMPIAEDIIDRIIANGHRVVFRPHPYCYKDKTQRRQIERIAARLKSINAASGSDHCISNNPKFDMIYPEVNDCINACDIMISDVTSVLADWIYTLKPYVTTDIQNAGADFHDRNPLTKGGYVLGRSLNDFDGVLAQAVRNDTLRDQRISLREHVLGVKLDQDPETVFLDTVNEIFTNFDKLKAQRELIERDG